MGRDRPLLVTGDAGLLGRALGLELARRGQPTVGYDLVHGHDVRDARALAEAASGCSGVVHLAAVSRVVWGQDDPQLCHETNVGGTGNAVAAARAAGAWVLFASSREVYGQPEVLPATEASPLRPMNPYGRSKVAGETLVEEARQSGVKAAVVRLCNVYGDAADHHDRVVPAFLAAALEGGELRVDGAGHTFDFVYLDDAVRGLCAVIDQLASGAGPPPVHLATGVGTTLGDLADLAIALGGGGHRREAPPRAYDVVRFVGDPARARAQLGWRAEVSLADGMTRLLEQLRQR